jgi:TPP-dependent pyruvate/acetoin dehydrogenase alpha subunit
MKRNSGNAAAGQISIEKTTALDLYRTMVRIRKFEEKLFFLFSTRAMPGSMHQYDGEEAVATGVCAHLEREDYITSTHRGHGHCIAKGADVKAIMAEMFAKSTGCCRGMGGSMHIADFGVGMLGANGIVAAGVPIAVGAGWSCLHRRGSNPESNVSVAFFGDGAVNEGAFHEAVNLAALWRLPVVFICENNLYGFSTHYRRTLLLEDIADRARAYGIPGSVVDGMDVQAVYEAAGAAVLRARRGEGPAFLECKTYRFRGHSRFEPAKYRRPEELESWKARDPIAGWRRRLESEYRVSPGELDELEAGVASEIEEAVAFAEASPDPDPDDYLRYIFA